MRLKQFIFALVAMLSLTFSVSAQTVSTAADLKNALCSTGAVVTLGDSITMTEVISIPQGISVTLDLKGKKITGKHSGYVFDITGSLTVKDSQGTGTVTGNSRVFNVKSKGSLTLNGGKFYKTSGQVIYTSGKLVVNGGVVKTAPNATLNVNTAAITGAGGTVELKAGTVTSVVAQFCDLKISGATVTDGLNIYKGAKGAEITAGTIKGDVTIANEASDKVTVTGGSFKDSDAIKDYLPNGSTLLDKGDGTFEVVAGQFKVGENYYPTLAAAAEAAQAGNEIVMLADATVEGTLALPAGIKLTSNGHTINGSIRMLGNLELNGALTITGGLWVGKSGETLTATLSGDKLTASYFMFQRGTYTINADIDAVYGYLSFEGTFEVNSTIHTTGANGEVLYINGNVTLNDGAVLDSDNSVFVCNDNAVLTLKPGSKVDSNVSITKSGAKLNIDATGMAAGALANITGTVTNSGNGTIAVVGSDKLEAKIVDGKIVLNSIVAKIGDKKYATLEAAFAAATDGQTITMLDDATPSLTSQRAITKAAVIDLNSKTMTLTEDDLYFGTTTFKNGTIVVDPSVKASTAVFWMFANQTLTFDNVKIVATGVTGTYLIGLDGNNSDLNLLNGSEILVENTTALDLDIICVNASTGNDIKVENSKVNVTNLDGRVFFRGNYTVKDSEVNLAGITKAGFHIEAGQTLSIEGTSKVNIEGEPRDGGINLIGATASYTKAETATVNATVTETGFEAKIGDAKYTTFNEAVAAAQDGAEVTIHKAGTYNVPSGKNLTITGAVDGVQFGPIAEPNLGMKNYTFNNVTFNYANDSHYKGLQYAGEMEYNNCTFNGQVFLYGQKETFNKCTFYQTTNNYNVWTYSAKEVAFNECTFNSAGKSVLIYHESATVFNNVAVAKSTFKASQAVDGKAAIEMDASLTAGINLTIDDATTATGFAAGNVSGNSLWNNKKGNADEANNDITVVVGDETVLAPAPIVVYYQDGTNEVFYDMLKAVPYTSNYPKLEGATIKLLADVAASGLRFMENDMVFDLNGHTYTITAGTGSQGTNTSGFQIRPEVTTDVTFKNGTIKVAEGAPVVYMFNNYATNFILEDVTVDCTNMAWSYGNSCYVVVSRGNATTTGARNVEFKGNTTIENFNSSVAGTAYSIDGTMTVGENVECGGSFKLAAGATLTAKEGLNVETVDGYILAYNNGVYATISTTANVATKAELQAALANDNIKTIVLTADIDYGTDQLAITKAITLDLGGKTLTTRNAFGGMSIKGNPTVKNGNIVHASNTAAIKVWNATAFEDLVIDVQGKGDANKTIGGIVLQSGSTTKVGSIKNVTIKGAALTNGIETYNCGDATENVIGSMENVTIDAQGTGLLISAHCGTATNCDIKGGVNAVEIFIKGNYSASLDLVDSKVEGGVYAHDEFSTNPDIVNNGTLKFTANEATTGADAADVTLEIARAEAEKVQGVLNDVMVNAKAKLNNVYYATFAEAFAAAKAGDTLTLLADLNMSEILVLDKAITLDGKGKTLTSTAGRAINVDCQGNVGIKNLTINASGERAINVIQKPANVTIENVTATAANYTVNLASSAGAAKVAISNSNLTGLNVVNVAAAGSEITINGGTITCNDQNANENYAALAMNKDAVGGKIAATGVTFDIKGDSKKASNGAVGGEITIDGKTDDVDIIVAYIQYGNYYNSYTSIEAAIAKAKDGETIGLIRDITASDIITIDKAITLDGNGKKLTSTAGRAINVSGADGATIKNLTIECSGERAINIIQNATNVTIENVTATAANYTVNVAASAPNAVVAIKGSTLNGLCTVNVSAAGAKVTVDKSTVNCNDNNTTVGESYAALSLNKEAVGGSIIATESTINVTAGSDSMKGRNGAENGTVTINGSTEGVTVTVAVITYAGSDNYHAFATLEKAIEFAKAGDVVTLIRDVTMDYGARDLLATAAADKAVTIDGEGHTLTLNQTNSDWSSIGLENNNKLVLKNMTINKAGKGATSGAWNTHAIIFSTAVEMENVTVNNSVAVAADAAFTNVVFKEANGYYSLWIEANGQTVTVKGGSMTATNGGRGIKIADQYINAPAKVKLSVDGTEFNTAKKAAVLVSSKAGAEITAANVNIENVAEDNVNFVWVDGDWATDFGNVTVNGKPAVMEDAASFVAAVTVNGAVKAYYATIVEAIGAVQAGEEVALVADVTASEVILLGKSLTINGNGYKVTSNATRVFRATTSNTEITLNDVNMVNTAVRVGTNDIRGISVDDVQNVKLTLNNCSVDFTDASANDWTYAVNVVGGSGHVVTVNGGAYEGANVINVRGANQTVTVKDATLTSLYPNNAQYFGACIYVVQNENSSVVATGNTFNGDNAFAFNVGYTPVEESDNIDNTKYVVAMIGDAYYTSIQDAVEAAQNGETIKLTQNVKMDTKTLATQNDGYSAIVNVAGKAVTLDLNGKKITVDAANSDLANASGKMLLAVFHADTKGELILTDNTEAKAGAVVVNVNDATVYSVFASESQYSDKSESGKITVEAGNYATNGKVSNAMFFADANEVITVNGGNFHCDQVSNTANYPWMFNTVGNNELHVTVNGGTFNIDINHQHRPFEVKVPETLAVKDNGDGTWEVVPAEAYITEMLGATVNEAGEWGHKVGYATIAEAIAAVKDGQTITLVKDITYAKDNASVNGEYVDGLVYTGDKSFTIDFNGKTITENGDINDYLVYLKNAGEKDNEITFKNGTIAINGESSNTAWAAITVGANSATHKTILNLDGMKVVNGNPNDAANQVIRVRKGSVVNLNEGTVVTSNGTSYGVVAETTATVNINDGAKVVHTNSKTTGGNQVYTAVSGNGTINVYDGAEIVSDNYGIHNMTTGNAVINIYGGTIEAKVAVKASTNGGAGESATVTIEGGNFKGALENYTDAATIVVKGGTFDAAVDTKYVATGYICKDNGDGTFGVIVDPKHGKVAQIIRNDYYAENQYFATINEAVQAAQSGETVTLIADVETSAAGYATIGEENYAVIVAVKGKDITLNLNGKSVTVNPTAEELANTNGKMLMSVFGMDTNGKLTLTGNGSVKVNANGANVYSLVAAYGEGSSVVIENGNYEADAVMASGSLIYSHEMITVMGGTYKLGNLATGANGSPWIFNTIGQNYTGVKVVGGTFPTDINHQFWANEVLVPEAYALKENSDGTWTVVDAVAYTNEKATSRNASWRHVGYASLEDAIAATGKYNCQDNTVTMIKDITLEPITVANGVKVALDLNSKTISGTDNGTASYGLITNKGDLTINGTGAITLTATKDRGWSAFSSVISNTVGGKLTVNGGTIQHFGGTAMAYAIDNLTNGKGTYAETVINGGVVKSKYIAIRQFLNGVEADNILTVNGGTLEGETASLYFQDPSKNANTGTLNVLDGTLAGDVYLDVTEGSTEWPVEVYIAKDALGQNDIHADNVPAEAAALVEYDTFWQVEQKNLAELTIEDACEEYINKIEKNVGVLTYERYFDDTEWQTIVLPFDVPVANLKQFEVAYIYNAEYKGKQANIDYVVIDENSAIETLRANYPYMIRAKEAGWNNIVVKEAKLMPTKVEILDCSSVFEKFSFIGNYATVETKKLDAKYGYFNLTSGAWSKMETVNPFRFYMQIEKRDGSNFVYPGTDSQVRMRQVNANGEVTGIGSVSEDRGVDFIFDLNGRRVAVPEKGRIYIVNGKKILF